MPCNWASEHAGAVSTGVDARQPGARTRQRPTGCSTTAASPCGAQFFDALSAFQGELRPEAAPQAVLRAIGQTAVGVLGVRCVAAFSLMPAQDFAEVLLFDEDGDIFESSLVDCPSGLRSVMAATDPCCTPAMNWTGFFRRFRPGWSATSDFGCASGRGNRASVALSGARSAGEAAAFGHAGAGIERNVQRMGAGAQNRADP